MDDESSIARYSRFATHTRHVASLRTAGDLVAALKQLALEKEVQGWVVFPTRDEQVAALAQHKEELEKIYRVPTPGWESIRWAWDKRNTYALAEKLGIPAPRTWYPRTAADLAELDGHFPVAIKPAIKENFVYATKQKAWRADNPSQLRELYDRASRHVPAGEIMIQDIVPGDGTCQYAYCAFFKDGHPVVSLAVCRRRQHPLEFGRSSTYVETTDLPLLEDYSVRFLREINYYGLVEMEYKRDPRDGNFRLLDVNGRTWGYHTIGEPAGVNFPHVLFADQMGEAVESCKGKSGVRWIRLLTDLPTGLVSFFNGQLDVRAYLRTLRDYHEEAVFSLEDPLPGIMEVALLPYLIAKKGF
jgi:predicted ATP-grasp superfamily ATP-dependent carboligase